MNPTRTISDETLQQICAQNNIEFHHAEKITVGFSNELYKVNDEYIFKFYVEEKYKKESFATELAVYQSDLGIKKPHLFASGFDEVSQNYYIILEFVRGFSLGTKWHLANDVQRENLIKEVCENLRDINRLDAKNFTNYGKSWREIVEEKMRGRNENLRRDQKISESEFARVNEILDEKLPLFDNDKTQPAFWDVHFDNFIVDENFELLAQIDFENVWLATLDFPLFTITKMIDNPKKYLSEEDEKFANEDDNKNLKTWYQKYYPEMFDFANLDERVFMYLLWDDLHLLEDWSDDTKLQDEFADLIKELK